MDRYCTLGAELFAHPPLREDLRCVAGVTYWREEEPKQNFGDFLTELFLQRALVTPVLHAKVIHLIGSVIEPMRYPLVAEGGQISYWGCGMRDATPLPEELRALSRFHGVRGPLTRDLLELPASTVLGDPGLLVPALYDPRPRPAGGTLCILHVLDPRDEADVRAQTGADLVVRADVAPSMAALADFIDLIAGAEFVLSGALHGAVVACAYGRAFAYFDSGYVDVPFKWADFAASVGIAGSFARTVSEGRQIHADETEAHLNLPPLAPILANAPFAPRHDAMVRALVCDGALAPDAARATLEALAVADVDGRARVEQLRAEWNAIWTGQWAPAAGVSAPLAQVRAKH